MASSSNSGGVHRYSVVVKTGRYKGAGKTCKGSAIFRFYAKDNLHAPSERHSIGGSFEAGKTRKVQVEVPHPIHEIEQLEVWLERPADTADVRWFVEHMRVEDPHGNCVKFFPFHRWITMKHQIVRVNNALLPQHDPNQQRRNESIHLEKDKYYFSTRVAKAIPIMSEVTESPEDFSVMYFTEVFILPTIKDTISQKLLLSFTKRWDLLANIDNIYGRALMNFARPKIVDMYKETISQDDWSPLDKVFASQRLIGTNPAVIQRVRSLEELRESMDLSEEDRFKHQMKGLALPDAVAKKNLFMVDYTTILRNLICKNGMIASPIALFYINDEDDLMPVAIQLFKHKGPSGPDNPVFFPDDDKYSWMLAKMWFNNADASFHQSSSHLGFTHLLIETIYLALRKTVSISHPLYHLMAPHFLYLLKVNSVAFSALVNEGGWVDTSMTVGVKGLYEIIRRRYQGHECALDDDETGAGAAASDKIEDRHLAQAWRLDREGNLENDIKSRGVEDLPKYYFRDDALAVYRAIKNYVSNVVNPHYADVDTLENDYEIQEWAAMLSAKYDEGGCEIQGVPGRGHFSNTSQLIDTITSVIYISSCMHASVNFLQYEQYGFPFNYPATLYGEPPRKKVGHDESDILQCLATKKTTLGSLAITHLLSQRATKKLGDFEVQYQFDKIGLDAVNKFQEELQKIQDDCDRDTTKEAVYDILNPKYIPNAISI